MPLWDCFEDEPHCNELLALFFDMVFEMSQSSASIGQPTRIGHVWRIIIGHSILATNNLLIYNKHMVHEDN